MDLYNLKYIEPPEKPKEIPMELCVESCLTNASKLPNGNESVWEHFIHGGAAAIVALTCEGNIILERQFRYPFHKVVTEIPAGKLDSPDEDRLEAAKRELTEETGYEAKELFKGSNGEILERDCT